MNDRFKFRVWDKEVGKMFTPTRHFNFCNVNGTIVCIESFCQYDGFYQKRIIKEFNDAILMQCTGLKDKNGKLIYEGDCLGGIYEGLYVHWCNECMQFQLCEKDYGCMACEGDIHWAEVVEDNNKLEVIGNIYEG